MSSSKVTELTSLVAPTRDDLLYVVDDAAGTPADYKTTVQGLIGGPVLFVAASDAMAISTKNADYVCDGTADDVQIQAAIDDLPAAGGTVALSEGTFTLAEGGTEPQWGYSYGVLINKPIRFIGNRSVLTIPDSAAMSNNGFCLLHPYNTNDVRIENISIDGNGSNQGANLIMGIYGHTVERLAVVGCDLQDTAGYAINADVNCTYCQIVNNYVHDNPGAGHHGIALHNSGDFNVISGNTVEGVGSYGIMVDTANEFAIVGNVINSALYLIAIADSSSRGTVVGNHLYGDIGTSLTIYTDAGSSGILITGNTIRAHSAFQGEVELSASSVVVNNNVLINGALQNVAADAIVRNNTGWVTENSGTGTIGNGTTSVAITHGLSVTPAINDISVTLAEDPTNTPGAIWVDTIGAAQFTVNCENDPGASNLDFGWRAVVL